MIPRKLSSTVRRHSRHSPKWSDGSEQFRQLTSRHIKRKKHVPPGKMAVRLLCGIGLMHTCQAMIQVYHRLQESSMCILCSLVGTMLLATPALVGGSWALMLIQSILTLRGVLSSI